MQIEYGPVSAEQQPAAAQQQTLYLILYPQSAQEEIVGILDDIGVSGYTETEKVVGRGPRGYHFDNQVWPGADGMIYCVVGMEKRYQLNTALVNFSWTLERNSKGLHGLHVFTWTCDQIV
jgi:hypothetical protein